MNVSCTAAGLIVEDGHVLFVKVTYGANNGCWMLPGGFVDEGETFQEAAIREVQEESGLTAKIKSLIGVRDGIRAIPNGSEHGIYLVFEMEVTSGTVCIDGYEVSEARFIPVEEALRDPLVIDLTKEMILAYRLNNNGLRQLQKAVQTNNSWTKYEVLA
ncbi:NUDIX hydrolase [Paenibacillus glycanilyticus]|uniref:NUDIX domain-containing protein n=1 Tax=Paenibacillus glycanilyticus TaxID=126569 RepID=UPI00203EB6ED|nr:NUDIX hydrolase [Paenibacillus glycanilyticus]MCM3629345.1 NUDIX hydrolase [Paenibacillus glycanilyticus]